MKAFKRPRSEHASGLRGANEAGPHHHQPLETCPFPLQSRRCLAPNCSRLSPLLTLLVLIVVLEYEDFLWVASALAYPPILSRAGHSRAAWQRVHRLPFITALADSETTPSETMSLKSTNGTIHGLSTTMVAEPEVSIRHQRPPPPPTLAFLDASTLDVPQPTENGGYTHTSSSKAKISAANKGKTPWNKGRQRSPEERERIAAGVRARNRERFLQQLAGMGLTEEEYEAQKKEERRKKDAERRARRTENGGYRPSEATKQKISRILKEKYAKEEFKPRKVDPSKVRRGFTHSEETRAKISESLKKRWATDAAYRENMRQKATASNTRQETRRKISTSLKKKWEDPEFRSEMISRFSSRKRESGASHDYEHRQRISEAMKAKWQDEVYREKTLKSIAQRKTNAALKPRQASASNNPDPAGLKSAPRKARLKKQAAERAEDVRPMEPLKAAKPAAAKTRPQVAVDSVPEAVAQAKPMEPKPRKRKTASKKASKASQTNKKATPKASTTTSQKPRPSSSAPKRDGNVDLLKQERRDLYDLLYGDEDEAARSLTVPAVGALLDENLDHFDPYGLDDF